MRVTPRIDPATGLTLAEHVRQLFDPTYHGGAIFRASLRVHDKHWGEELCKQSSTPGAIKAIHSLLPTEALRCELARQQPHLIGRIYQFRPIADSREGLFQRHDFGKLLAAVSDPRFAFPAFAGQVDLMEQDDLVPAAHDSDALLMCRAAWWLEWKLPLRQAERAWITKHAPHLASEARRCPKERSEK